MTRTDHTYRVNVLTVSRLKEGRQYWANGEKIGSPDSFSIERVEQKQGKVWRVRRIGDRNLLGKYASRDAAFRAVESALIESVDPDAAVIER